MTMVERVARALAAEEAAALCWGDARDGRMKAYVESEWRSRMPLARAAIAAMREPTPAMRLAGSIILTDERRDRWPHSSAIVQAHTTYGAMIDAALAETADE